MANHQQSGKPVSILGVEVDQLQSHWVGHALSGGRYHVRTVASAEQALQYLKRIRSDAVVIGGHLPGIEVTAWFSATKRRYPDLPVIVNPVRLPAEPECVVAGPGAFHCLVLSL